MPETTCRVEPLVDQAITSTSLKEVDLQTGSTTFQAYIICVLRTLSMLVLSRHTQTSKLLDALVSHGFIARFCELLPLQSIHLQYFTGTHSRPCTTVFTFEVAGRGGGSGVQHRGSVFASHPVALGPSRVLATPFLFTAQFVDGKEIKPIQCFCKGFCKCSEAKA